MAKKKTEKRFQIELNERQLRLLSWVCDTFPRLMEGQSFAYQDMLESAWERRCKKETGKMMDDEWDGGWHKMREDAEVFVNQIKARFWGLRPCENWGIHYDDVSDIIWDIHQVARHTLWLSDENPDKPNYTVDASPAHQFGDEPLVTVKEIKP